MVQCKSQFIIRLIKYIYFQGPITYLRNHFETQDLIRPIEFGTFDLKRATGILTAATSSQFYEIRFE